MATNLEQLRYIDEQLAAAALPQDQSELVQLHRLTGMQLRSQRLQELGPAPGPEGTPEYEEWEKTRKEVEAEVELRLAETRLSVEGLEESWEKWLHIEKLRVVREQLLQQTAAEGILEHHKGEDEENGHANPVSPSPGQLQDAAGWESLQIAPLNSPGSWEVQQQQAAQLQQHLAAHMQGLDATSSGMEQQALDEQQMHLQQQWQSLAHAQEAAAQSGPQHQAQAATAPNPEGVPMKHCRRCNTHKPVTQFYKSKANADGYDGRCKACDAVQCAVRRKRKERIENPTVEWKVCRRCGINKSAAEFYRNKTNGDGLYNNCKSCFSQDAQNRRERLPPLEERTAAAKECRRCKETKPASQFYKNKHMSDGLYTHCKSCYTEAANARSAGRAPAETKRCRRCGNTKEASEFYVSKMTADGLQSYCKSCYAVASAARRSRNQDSWPPAESEQGPKDTNDYGQAHQHAMQEHLMQGGMVDPMQQQVMGVAQMDPALQAAQMQQLGYDPAVIQATLGDQALSHHAHLDHPQHHLDHVPHGGMEHHTGLEHHTMPQHHLDHQGLPQVHHHLDPVPPTEYQQLDHTGHAVLEHQQHEPLQHEHELHEHQAYVHVPQSAPLSHQHEHAVM